MGVLEYVRAVPALERFTMYNSTRLKRVLDRTLKATEHCMRSIRNSAQHCDFLSSSVDWHAHVPSRMLSVHSDRRGLICKAYICDVRLGAFTESTPACVPLC